MTIQISAKALILSGNDVLLIKNEDRYGVGTWYCLPGGVQWPGETLVETLQRECREETSLEVIVGPLLWVREFLRDRHQITGPGLLEHKIEVMFKCSVNKDSPKLGTGAPDSSQIGVEWVSLDNISETNVFPKKLQNLRELLEKDFPVYWGDTL
ncbi:MAG: NUDIX domain-containing protein [Candidatus Thiodiazotropha sp.]